MSELHCAVDTRAPRLPIAIAHREGCLPFQERPDPSGGYGKKVTAVMIGLKTSKGLGAHLPCASSCLETSAESEPSDSSSFPVQRKVTQHIHLKLSPSGSSSIHPESDTSHAAELWII